MLKKVSTLKKLPGNPRLIKDDKYRKLVQSIKQFPVMLKKRKLVIDENGIVLGGNQRLSALKELGIKEVEVDIFTKEDFTQAIEDHKKATGEDVDRDYIINQFVVKDNVGFGEWDMDILANEYDAGDLFDWGVDISANNQIDANLEWTDMPEFNQEDKTGYKSLIVHFETEKDYIDFGELIEQKLTDKTKSTWFPFVKIESLSDKAYE